MACYSMIITAIIFLTCNSSYILVSIHIVGLTNGGLGRNCDVHDVCGSAVVCGSILVLRCVVSVRGDELHAFLVKDGIDTCKVGFAAKKHAEKDAEFLDGLFLRVTKVITKESVAVEDRRRMYQNYGSAQAIIITKRKALIESSK